MTQGVIKVTTRVLPGHRLEVIDPNLDDGESVEVVIAAARSDASYGLSERFNTLAERWRNDTAPLSSTSQIAMHPAYQEIIGIGRDVVPLILNDMKRQPAHWFWALRSITGEDPVAETDRGKLAAMTDAWLKWGRENGLIS